MLINHTSRFDVAIAAVRGAKGNPEIQVKRQELLASLSHAIKKANVSFSSRVQWGLIVGICDEIWQGSG
jgi:hypothetical protein